MQSLIHLLSHVFSQSLIPSSNKPAIPSFSFTLSLSQPAALLVFHSFTHSLGVLSVILSPFRPHSQLLCHSVFHSFTHSLGVLSIILSLFRPQPAALSFSLSLFHPLTRCSLSHSFTLSPTASYSVIQSFTHSLGVLSVNLSFCRPLSQLLCQSVFHSFTHSAFFPALSQVTGHPASHPIATCVIAITVAIGTAALIAAAVRQSDTAPNRYSNKNPRCTNVPATEPILRYIIMQFTFRINRNFYWRHYN